MIQVVHPHANKANAVAKIASIASVAPKHVMAIGDAPNDVEMIRWAGLGIAVANAWPEAQQAAHTVVPSNDDDGVAEALETYALR